MIGKWELFDDDNDVEVENDTKAISIPTSAEEKKCLPVTHSSRAAAVRNTERNREWADDSNENVVKYFFGSKLYEPIPRDSGFRPSPGSHSVRIAELPTNHLAKCGTVNWENWVSWEKSQIAAGHCHELRKALCARLLNNESSNNEWQFCSETNSDMCPH